jgi:hypothetical protein
MLGGSFILFYENCWFQFFPHLRESTPLPNTGFPVIFICGTGTNTHVFEKKKKKTGARN